MDIETRHLQIRTFGGSDRVDMSQVKVHRHARTFLGGDGDWMSVEGSHVGGNFVFSGDEGDDGLAFGYPRTWNDPNVIQGTAWCDGGEGAGDSLYYVSEDYFHERQWTNWETTEEKLPYDEPPGDPLPVDTRVSTSINSFGLDLYEEIQDEEGNLFFSPLSISTALAMVYAGAGGETAAQMADVLHFQEDSDALHAAFGELLDDLNAAGDEGEFDLSIAQRALGPGRIPPAGGLPESHRCELPRRPASSRLHRGRRSRPADDQRLGRRGDARQDRRLDSAGGAKCAHSPGADQRRILPERLGQ